MPKLNHFQKKTEPDPLRFISDPKERRRIIDAFRATEMYMFASNVAMGMIMIVSINFEVDPSELRYQRTPAKAKPSEANVSAYLRGLLLQGLLTRAPNYINELIRGHSQSECSQKYQNMA